MFSLATQTHTGEAVNPKSEFLPSCCDADIESGGSPLLVPLFHVTRSPAADLSSFFNQTSRKRKAPCAVLTSDCEVFTGSPQKLFIVALSQTENNTENGGSVTHEVNTSYLSGPGPIISTSDESSQAEIYSSSDSEDDETEVRSSKMSVTIRCHVTGADSAPSKVLGPSPLVSMSSAQLAPLASDMRENNQREQAFSEGIARSSQDIEPNPETSNGLISFHNNCRTEHASQAPSTLGSLPALPTIHTQAFCQEGYQDENEGSEYECDFIYRVLHPVEKMQGVSLLEELAMAETPRMPVLNELTGGGNVRHGNCRPQGLTVHGEHDMVEKQQKLLELTSMLGNQSFSEVRHSTTANDLPVTSNNDCLCNSTKKDQVDSNSQRGVSKLNAEEAIGGCFTAETEYSMGLAAQLDVADLMTREERDLSPDTSVTDTELYETADEASSQLEIPVFATLGASNNGSEIVDTTNPRSGASKSITMLAEDVVPVVETSSEPSEAPQTTPVYQRSVSSACDDSDQIEKLTVVGVDDTLKVLVSNTLWPESSGCDASSRSFLMRQRECRASFSDSCLSVCKDEDPFGDEFLTAAGTIYEDLHSLHVHDQTKDKLSDDSLFVNTIPAHTLSFGVNDTSGGKDRFLYDDFSFGRCDGKFIRLPFLKSSVACLQPGQSSHFAVRNNNASVPSDNNMNAISPLYGKSALCKDLKPDPKLTASGHYANIPLSGLYPHLLETRCLLTQNNNSLPSTSRGATQVKWNENGNYSAAGEEDYSLTYSYSQKKVAKPRSTRMRASYSLQDKDMLDRVNVRSIRPLRSLPTIRPLARQDRKEDDRACLGSPCKHSSNCRCLHFDCLRRRGEMLHEHIMQNLHLLKSFARDGPNKDPFTVQIKGSKGRNTLKCPLSGENPLPSSSCTEHSRSRRSSPTRFRDISPTSSKVGVTISEDACRTCNRKTSSPGGDRSQTKVNRVSSQSSLPQNQVLVEDNVEGSPKSVGISVSVKSNPRDGGRSAGRLQKTVHDLEDCDRFLRKLEENRRRSNLRSALADTPKIVAPSHIPASIRHNKTCFGETCKCKTRSARSFRASLGRTDRITRPWSSDYCHFCSKPPLSVRSYNYTLNSCDDCHYVRSPRASLVPTAWCAESKWRPTSRLKKSSARRRGPSVTYTERQTREIITRPRKLPAKRQVETREFRTTGNDAASYFYSFSRENLPRNLKSRLAACGRVVHTDSELPSFSKGKECTVSLTQTELVGKGDKQTSPRLTFSADQGVVKTSDLAGGALTSPIRISLDQKETQTSRSLETLITTSLGHPEPETRKVMSPPIPFKTRSEHIEGSRLYRQNQACKGILVKSRSPDYRVGAAYSGNQPGVGSLSLSRDDLSLDSVKTCGTMHSALSFDTSPSKTFPPPNKNPNHSISTPFSSRLSITVDQPSHIQFASSYLGRQPDPNSLATMSDTSQQGHFSKTTSTVQSDLQLTSEVSHRTSSYNSISQSTDSTGVGIKSSTQTSSNTAPSTEHHSSFTFQTDRAVPEPNDMYTGRKPANMFRAVRITSNSPGSSQPISTMRHCPSSPFSPIRDPVSPINISSSPFSPIQESSRSPSPSHQSDRTHFFSNLASCTPSPTQRTSLTPSSAYRSIPSTSPVYKTTASLSHTYDINQSPSKADQSFASISPTHQLNRSPSPKRSVSPARHSSRSPSPTHRAGLYSSPVRPASHSPVGQSSQSPPSSTQQSSRSPSPNRQSSHSPSPTHESIQSFSLKPLFAGAASLTSGSSTPSEPNQRERKDIIQQIGSPSRMSPLQETRESSPRDSPASSPPLVEPSSFQDVLSQQGAPSVGTCTTLRSSPRSLQSARTSFSPEIQSSAYVPYQNTVEVSFQQDLESPQSTRASSSTCWSRQPSPLLNYGSRVPSSQATSCTSTAEKDRPGLSTSGSDEEDLMTTLASLVSSLAHLGNSLGSSVKQIVSVGLAIALLSGGLACCNRCYFNELTWEASLGIERMVEDIIKHFDLRHFDLPPQ
ncbi:hypothetical protein BaRGS_00030816 [Batillaria attramentaria]|uniref:Uncharacterized protein n=1 Tax=Batillaria attramentaria TaxID=370345 RepID=A0ABD0JSD3_9CAEN